MRRVLKLLLLLSVFVFCFACSVNAVILLCAFRKNLLYAVNVHVFGSVTHAGLSAVSSCRGVS